MAKDDLLPPAEAHRFVELLGYAEHGIASRILAKKGTSNVTLFAFDAGQGLTEHTSPFDALVVVLEGALTLTIGGKPVEAPTGSITRMPANVPHAVDAGARARMLLVMLRDPAPAP
ncbi:cupin domain-containing protein [Anaeromyxobacter dehalogenans]|uniref:Cupin domain protein n=1 Tax=Anaeromyxobacter dehalogenans (strain 2CP-C) TaxID=290397 RepID=Q2IK23_ANADE|nr:cupin domain-containing protein [Anaeromyxobacter dehalogenans]ABC81999.1 Cupin domain protein [Anaeromyxobacter dehalogenans 2CP-C]